MPPSNFKRKWVKLWIDECLTGTIREDLTPDERSVWYDFLLFAGRNRPPGNISANETTAITPRRLAAILNIPVQLLARAVKKFEESGRVEIGEAGIIKIMNWDKYQFTDYDRQKVYRQDKPEPPASRPTPVSKPEPEISHAPRFNEMDRFNQLAVKKEYPDIYGARTPEEDEEFKVLQAERIAQTKELKAKFNKQ